MKLDQGWHSDFGSNKEITSSHGSEDAQAANTLDLKSLGWVKQLGQKVWTQSIFILAYTFGNALSEKKKLLKDNP